MFQYPNPICQISNKIISGIINSKEYAYLFSHALLAAKNGDVPPQKLNTPSPITQPLLNLVIFGN